MSDNFLTDMPKVSIAHLIDNVVDEGRALNLTCTANGNPRAMILWKKLGLEETLISKKQGHSGHVVEQLEFDPIQKKDNGTYMCQAKNAIGVSKDKLVEIKVRGEY